MKLKTNLKRFLRQIFVLIALVSSGSVFADMENAGLQDLKGTKIDIGVKQGKIIEIMNMISSSTEYAFIYEDGIKNELNKKVKIKNGNNLHDILSDITKQSNLEFRAVNNNIVVRKRSIKETSSITNLQKVVVTGKVTSMEDDSGLPGVNIVEKGTTNGTVSDIDGNYSLEVPGAESVLVFSSVGFLAEEVTVGTQTVINLSMSPDITQLGEVVVTALGIKKEVASLGYSVSSVQNEDITQGGQVNVLKALDGKITGVNLVNLSNDPTSSTMVIIRSATSISGWKNRKSGASAQPLFVVDGIPIGRNDIQGSGSIDVGNILSELNPDDIESITVLKGASAGALYGKDAGNGVIMITTKTGAGGKKGIGVSINSSLVFDQIYKTMPVQNEYFQGDRWDKYSSDETSSNGPGVGSSTALDNDYKQWDILNQEWYMGPLVARGEADRIDAFMRTGLTATNNVSVTGNYDEGNYRLSYTNLYNAGVVPNTETKRNTVTFSGLYNLSKNLKVSSSASYSRTFVPQKVNVSSRGDLRDGIIEMLYGMSPNIQSISDFEKASHWIDGYDGIYQNTSYLDDKDTQMHRYEGTPDGVEKNNPYYSVYNMIQSYTRDNTFGKVQLDYQVAKPLSIILRSGVHNSIYHYQKRIPYDNQRAKYGEYAVENSRRTRFNTDLMANYNETFGDFRVDVLVGGNLLFTDNFDSNINSGGRKAGLARPNDFSMGAINRDKIRYSYGLNTDRTQSLYSTVTVDYKGIVYLTGTARKDWIGILETQKNSHTYPGASVSWLASETFALPDWVNMAKARYGWATVGHNLGSPLNVDTYGFAGEWAGAKLGTVGGALVDPNLEPEINVSNEWGIDLAFLDNRIMFEYTGYNKEHRNQLDYIPIVKSSGFSSMLTNVGTVTAIGTEASLTVVPVRNNEWEWDVTANFTKGTAKVTEMPEDFETYWRNYGDETAIRLTEGEVIGTLWGQRALKKITTGQYAGQMLINSDYGHPDWDYDDKENDLYTLGNYNPDYLLGIVTGVKYKGFRLAAVGSYRSGGIYISRTNLILMDDGKDPGSVTGDGKYWEGGRVGNGGFAWPDPAEMQFPFPESEGEERAFDDASYWIGAFVDPRAVGEMSSGGDEITARGYEYGDQTYVGADGNSHPIYIENGADPTATLYRRVEEVTGNQWDWADFRTFDATNFKLREVSLTYSIPTSFTQKIKCQTASVSFIANNIAFWTKSGLNEDPETAFDGFNSSQGISRFGLPSIRQLGFKINASF